MFVAWVMSQPTDFDTFMEGQKTFVDDLYSGQIRHSLRVALNFSFCVELS